MRMRKPLLAALTAGLVLVPAVALAETTPTGQDRANAARLCSAQRTAMGVPAFKLLYGTNADRSNAFGKCVSKLARLQVQNRENAAKQCRSEQNDPTFAATHDGKTFEQFYGTGKGKNAFGRCVSTKAKAASAEQQQATINAAKACKAERAQMGAAAFRAKYGTNPNKRDAFGKCVSLKASQ
jgi:hypothetical protein